ncbi:MAG: DUF3307 domain-containing protein [Adhaeribacter sp.]
MSITLSILLRLVLAHMVTGFIFNPQAWEADKKRKKLRSPYLYLHGLLAGLAAGLFVWESNPWALALVIAVCHIAIDAGKQYAQDNLLRFLVSQALHLAVLVVAWLAISDAFGQVLPLLGKTLASDKFLVLVTGFAFVIWPVSYLISKATVRWRREVEMAVQASGALPGDARDSLEKAGMYIGMFERVLVLIFVLSDQFEAIGFLIAAKSILRFSDRTEQKPRKQTEYVLIGTLISFTITIILGLLMKAYLK